MRPLSLPTPVAGSGVHKAILGLGNSLEVFVEKYYTRSYGLLEGRDTG